MFSDKESGVGVRGTVRSSGAQDDGQERAEETAATLAGTSVRLSYADGEDPVNRPWIGLESQVAGSGQPDHPPAQEQRRGWRLMIFCARATRGLEKALVGRAQWKINQPPSLER